MNINKTLFDVVRHHVNGRSEDVRHFLLVPADLPPRYELAIGIAKGAMNLHQKEGLGDYLAKLRSVEKMAIESGSTQRDHVAHALLCYLLGLYIKATARLLNLNSITDFEWRLAALFHDVGYPVTMRNGQTDAYFETIRSIVLSLIGGSGNTANVRTPRSLSELSTLTNNPSGVKRIGTRVKEWGLKIDIENAFHNVICEDEEAPHGMVSALSVLYVLDRLYEYHNPDRNTDMPANVQGVSYGQQYFDNDIVSACTAIFLHDLDKKYFTDSKLTHEEAPLAFLLRLADTLQDWERPGKDLPKGRFATDYNISVTDSQLHFVCPKAEKKRLLKELTDALEVNDAVTIEESPRSA